MAATSNRFYRAYNFIAKQRDDAKLSITKEILQKILDKMDLADDQD